MDTLSKIVRLMNEHNCDNQMLASSLGLNRQAITDWKAGRSKSYLKYIYQIADYFGVSVDYLLGNAPEPSKASKQPEPTEQPELPDLPEDELIPLNGKKLRMVPLFEDVSAGFGAYASGVVEDYMPVYFSDPSEADETLCIRVRGDSMSPKIENGDIIQVHKQESVDSGSVAVVLVDDDQGLVKKVFYGTDWIELQSFNPDYRPMRFDGADVERVRVVGLVTQTTKMMNGRRPNSVRVADNKKELLSAIDKMDADQLREFNQLLNNYMRSKEKK